MIGGRIWKDEWMLMNIAWGQDYLSRTLGRMLWEYRVPWSSLDSITWGKSSLWVNQDNEFRRDLLIQGQWK